MYYYWALIRNIYYNYCVCILVSDDVLKFLQDGLLVRPLASVSAVGIQNLCRYCKGQMANLFDTLLEVVRLADTLGITNNSVIGLLTGECHTHLNHCGIIIIFFFHYYFPGSVNILLDQPSDKVSVGLHGLCALNIQKITEVSLLLLSMATRPCPLSSDRPDSACHPSQLCY